MKIYLDNCAFIAFPDSVKYKNNIQLIDKIDKLSIYLYFMQSGNAITGHLMIKVIFVSESNPRLNYMCKKKLRMAN